MRQPAQGDLFPFAAPETVLAHIRRLEALALAVGPELTPAHCLRLLGDLALTATTFDAIAASIRNGPAWQTREQLPPIAPASPSLNDPLEPARRWRSRPKPGWPYAAGRNSS